MTTITFSDEKLRDRLREWMQESEYDQLDTAAAQRLLGEAFKDGWGACMSSVHAPAVELCMFFVRCSLLCQDKEAKLVLNAEVLEHVLALCKAVVGNIDLVALQQVVQAREASPEDDSSKS